MGVERTVAVLNGFDDNYRTQIWQPIIQKIEQLCQMEYGDKTDSDYINEDKQCWVDVRKSMRLIADHLRAAVFIIADGVEPSNKEAGYVLRRLIRRSIRQGKILGINDNFTAQVAQSVLDNQDNLAGVYPELNQFREHILEIVTTEENKFRKTLNSGLREIEKYKNELSSPASESKPKHVKYRDMGYQAFYFYESFGFPLEMFLEEIKDLPLGIDQEAVRSSFEEAKNQHTEKSRTLSAGKFKSGLADHGEITTKYHTATHLLHAALRQVLGSHVQQSGSNLNSERLRFDFSHPDKLTEDQLGQVASIVNQQIQAALPVTVETLPFVQAQSQGALAFFGAKYPEMVTVYTVGDSNQYFSKEVCTGPHVDNTSKLGKFEIIKEESAGSGKRRIYAVLK
jgi:alanyl-tRNA synthetase